MNTQFALDLRLARRKAGLTQADTALLLGVRAPRLSLLEHGRKQPSLVEICTLSVIYGRSFESLFSELMEEVRRSIREKIARLPARVRQCGATLNREASLKQLERRLWDEAFSHVA